MSTAPTGTEHERGRRADAVRNRERILAAAAAAFLRDGDAASIRGIAADAGVGAATLLRHFPSREDLVAATYERELGLLCDQAGRIAADDPGLSGIRVWMLAFVDYMATKAGMAEALRAAVASGLNERLQTLQRLTAALDDLLAAGRAVGQVRDEVLPADVLAALGGIALMAGRPDQLVQSERLIDLLVAGLRR